MRLWGGLDGWLLWRVGLAFGKQYACRVELISRWRRRSSVRAAKVVSSEKPLVRILWALLRYLF